MEKIPGKIAAKQCEGMLASKDSVYLSLEEASALLACPCLDSDGDVDFRALPDVLVPVDLRAEMQRYADSQARASLLGHLDKVWDAFAAADKAKKGTLPLDKFDQALKSCPGVAIRYPVWMPGMAVQAGALRQAYVDYGAFGNHAAVVHDSELAIMRKGRSDEVCMRACFVSCDMAVNVGFFYNF